MTRWLQFAVLSAACSLGLAGAAAARNGLPDGVCDKVRPAAYESPAVLDQRPTTIVAIGSSSTAGIARNSRQSLYPAALEATLRQRWPQAEITVVNKGKGGEVMAETLRRFEADVLSLKPSLVVWQLGVNDVLRFNGLDGRRDEIRTGLKLLGERGIPVILLDLQYAPIVIRDPDSGPMQELIDASAREGVKGRVFHFKRYAVMKRMAEDEGVPMAAMTDSDGLHMTDAMHACVGRLLAEMIAAPSDLSSPLLRELSHASLGR